MEAKRERRESLLIVLGAFAFAVLRSPILLFHGRVVAEEGSTYFQQGWDAGPLRTLSMVHQGYYSLFMNTTTFVGTTLVPLEWVGFVFTTASLLVLLLTVYMAVTCEQFQNTRSRVIAAGVCLLTPSIEVWLTAEDAQFYLPVCVALICISNENRHRIIRSFTLLLAGLTGPASCLLTPFFLYRAYLRRTAGAMIQAAILLLCSILQASVLLGAVRTGARDIADPVKLEWFGPVLVLKIFSVTFFTRLGAFLSQRIVIRHQNLAVCLLFWAICLLFLAFFWKMAKIGGWAAKMCFGMALVSLSANYIGIGESLSILFIGTFRYFFTGFVLLWMVLALANGSASQRVEISNRRLAKAAIYLALFCGGLDAAGYWSRFQDLDPRWSEQVRAWRANPETPIRVCPSTWLYPIHLHPR